MLKKNLPKWTSNTPGQYGSNGINSDGTLMNVGNKLGKRPCIKLFPNRTGSSNMKSILQNNYQCNIFDDKTYINNQRLLWDSCYEGNTQLVKTALANGAELLEGDPTRNYYTALHLAVLKKRLLTTKYLLSLENSQEQKKCLSKTGELPIDLVSSFKIKELFK